MAEEAKTLLREAGLEYTVPTFNLGVLHVLNSNPAIKAFYEDDGLPLGVALIAILLDGGVEESQSFMTSIENKDDLCNPHLL